MTEFYSEFVQESKEAITDLNNALLDLERSPEDDDAMDQVFRTAHTLKGNAGALGLDPASELAHALEDLLDAIRAGSLSVSPELMDDVFDAVDLLEAMVEEVENHGEIRSDPHEQVESLRSWVEESTGLVTPDETDVEATLKGLDRSGRRQHQVFHARLSIEDGGGGTVIDALRDAFDLLATDPSESRVRDGNHHGTLDVAFGSAVDEAAIAAALNPVEAVEDAIITEVDDATVESAVAATTDSGGTDIDDVDPDDLSVDQLLDQFEEYDDLDEAVDEVEDIQGLEMDDLGEAGSFADVVDEDVQTTPEETDQSEAEPDEEEIEDSMVEFEELQNEYDEVGLEEMESELEGVEFGEYDEEDEVGFDELLDEEEIAAEPAAPSGEPAGADAEPDTGVEATGSEPAPPSVEAPGEDAIASAIEAARDPPSAAEDVYHVRLGIVGGGDSGRLVVEALRDAFDLLGTQPSEEAIARDEYGDHVDAVFGAEVGIAEIESALDPVEEVADAAVTTVTDRVEFPAPTETAAGTDPEVLDAEGEIQNAHSEFQQMQEAFDQVGLEEMESELEGVEFGEYDEEEEVGFDELLEDVDEEPEPDRPSVEAPDEDAVGTAIEAATVPETLDNDVFHVRLGIVEKPEVNNGHLVVEALRDAFELLGTSPSEDAIGAGEYDDHIDAVFASHVDDAEIRSALAPVEEVSEAAITEVTDRIEAPEPTADAGTEPTAETGAAAEAEEDVEDPMAEFEELQDEYDRVGIDQMESELDGVEFGEYDAEDEVGFDELLGDEAAEAEAEAETADPAEEEAFTGVEADAGGFDDAEGEAFSGAESADTFGGADDDAVAEAGEAEEFGEVDVGETDDFGEVEVGETEFGETTTAPDDAFSSPEGGFGDEEVDDVEVGEISVEDDASETDFGVDVEGGDAETEEFGGVDVGETDEFGEVDVGETDEFGDVGTEDEGSDELPEEARADVDTIKGIGTGYADRLADADVETVGDLVTADATDLAGETDISESRIGDWVERAPVAPAELGVEPEVVEPEPEPSTAQEMDEIQSIRVDIDQVDDLLNLVEGLVTTRARLRRAVDEGADPDTLYDELDELDVISEEMQDNVIDMRLVPVRTVTQRLPRVVRDISRDQGKRVDFSVEGEDVEIDRSILNRIGDPLIHLVRNAVDHGIEPPGEREARGKSTDGSVTVRVDRQRDDAVIEVIDDGRGLDPDALREKAVEEGVLHEDAAEALSDDDAYELIFEAGLTTTDEVTDVSGRGVGMDVVKSTVEELDGRVDVESDPGEGTTVRLVLPVSVAISEVVFLQAGDEEYGLPIKYVDEIGGMRGAERIESEESERIRTADGEERELIELHDALEVPGKTRANGGGMLVTIETDIREAAVHCDTVRGQQEVVVKPFDGLLADIPGLGGAAVLGEGEVVNILDIESL